ncbi:MAG: superoxide dismutase, Ni [Gammaproteobacteria bacterium]|nr:superoxide dismutase, Ni [Gammaproteobacteria bacterium]
MLHSALNLVDRMVGIDEADAHCDIPCKIYDPSTATIAALSVVRLMDIMAETMEKPDSLGRQNTIARCVMRKEEEAEKVKHEIRIIWGDYIKAPQMEKHPHISDLVHRIMLKSSACKQEVNRADGEALVALVNQFAEIFWDTKDVRTTRAVCPYPPSMEVVYPVLG